MRVLLIIPAYNEAENLPAVIGDIEAQNRAGAQLDYLIVSDGSTDGTAELCRSRGYHLLELPVNLGLAGCFQTGMRYASLHAYDCAVQFDGDGQHRAADIPGMLAVMQAQRCELVLGSRFLAQKKGVSPRELGSRLLTAAIWLSTGRCVSDPTCGLRLYSRALIERFAWRINYAPEPDTVSFLIKNGASVAEAPVEILERRAGHSYLNAWNAVKYMTRMLLSILLIQNFRSREV